MPIEAFAVKPCPALPSPGSMLSGTTRPVTGSSRMVPTSRADPSRPVDQSLRTDTITVCVMTLCTTTS
jgi:hypothetical protein